MRGESIVVGGAGDGREGLDSRQRCGSRTLETIRSSISSEIEAYALDTKVRRTTVNAPRSAMATASSRRPSSLEFVRTETYRRFIMR